MIGHVALLSIHPPYADGILTGTKLVELRKASLREGTTHVAIYATSPVQRVVGLFEVAGADVAPPDELWTRYRDVVAIDRTGYDAYFAGRELGHAIRVGQVRRLAAPARLDEIDPDLRPPQSVVYLRAPAAARLETLLEATPPTCDGVRRGRLRHIGRQLAQTAAGFARALHTD